MPININNTYHNNTMLDQISQKNRKGFTLVEIMIVVAIIALLASIAIPSYIRSRERAQASTVLNNLRLLESAKDKWALETNQSSAGTVLAYDGGPPPSGLAVYLKDDSPLRLAAEAAAGANGFTDPRFPNLEYDLGTVGAPVGIVANTFDPAVVPDSYFAGFRVAGVIQ